MTPEENYLSINKQSWNKRTDIHVDSAFYDMPGFLSGKTSLKEIELALLGDIKGKSVLHLQCHFGQDTISLARMGAKATGVDLSDRSIDEAKKLALATNADAQFICCDVYDLPNHCSEKFDMVFTSYGTVGWLPDTDKWAHVISHFLKPGGQFIFVEFHPVVWMMDTNFEKIAYNYFNVEPIVETESGTYTDRSAEITQQYVSWNHNIAEVVTSLLAKGLELKQLREYDYSPYNCFNKTIEFEPGKFRIQHLGNKLPMVYALVVCKS